MAMLTLEQQQTLAFEHVRNALVHRLGRKASGAQWQQFEDRLEPIFRRCWTICSPSTGIVRTSWRSLTR